MDRAARDEIGGSSKKQRLVETPQGGVEALDVSSVSLGEPNLKNIYIPNWEIHENNSVFLDKNDNIGIELLRGAVLPADRAHINSLHPHAVASQLMQCIVQFPALVDRLTQDCIQNQKNLESLEAVLEIEKAEKLRWELLYNELYSNMRIEQSEKEEARMKIIVVEEELDGIRKYIKILKEQIKLMKCLRQKDAIKIQKLNEKVLDLVIENQELNVQNQQREDESLLARKEQEENSMKIKELNEYVHDLEIENQELIVQNWRREDESLHARKELEKDSMRIRELNEEIHDLEFENQELIVQNRLREGELDEDAIKIQKLTEKVDNLESENQELYVQNCQREKESLHARKELEECKSQLQILQRDMIVEENLTYVDRKACRQLIKEMNNNLELISEPRDTHTELLLALSDITSGSNINYTVKRIGYLDVEPFLNSCKLEFPSQEAEIKAFQLRYSWQNYLSNVKWNPFKITVNVNGHVEEVLNTNDPLLRKLKEIQGDEIYNAVTKALKELNECNPIDRLPVPTLWNSKEDRRATSAEVIRYVRYQKRGIS